MSELRQDEKRLYIYFRMPSECFDEMLSLIKEDITKMDTNYREAVSAEERLAIKLSKQTAFFNINSLIQMEEVLLKTETET